MPPPPRLVFRRLLQRLVHCRPMPALFLPPVKWVRFARMQLASAFQRAPRTSTSAQPSTRSYTAPRTIADGREESKQGQLQSWGFNNEIRLVPRGGEKCEGLSRLRKSTNASPPPLVQRVPVVFPDSPIPKVHTPPDGDHVWASATSHVQALLRSGAGQEPLFPSAAHSSRLPPPNRSNCPPPQTIIA